MLSEEFVSAICGPPLSASTAVAKDVGIYCHTLSPAYSVRSSFKKSSVPPGCLAVSDTHVFAAQHEKAYVHVYSRLRGNQEAFVALPERIRCLALAGDSNVLALGTSEGRLMLWEVCTGRLVSTPPRHVQGVSCVTTTAHHVLTGSDDSDVHVWSLSRLLELDLSSSSADPEHEPERTLSNHRAGITALAVGSGTNPNTVLCVSASKDKSCIIWNHQAGHMLRTILFPSSLLCITLDPAARALFASCEDSSLYLVEFFGDAPLLGLHAEDAATVVQISSSSSSSSSGALSADQALFGVAPPDAGPASCLATSYDGMALLTGHPRGQIFRWDVADVGKTPVELASLNAAVTNLVFVSPLSPPRHGNNGCKAPTIVKPSVQADRSYTLTTQFLDCQPGPDAPSTKFDRLLETRGFPQDVLEEAVVSAVARQDGQQQQPGNAGAANEAELEELQRKNDELWDIIAEQRRLQKHTVQLYIEAKSAAR